MAAPHGQLYLPVDVSKLSVAVRMLIPLLGLPVALQTVIHLSKQLPRLCVANAVSSSGQFVRQCPCALTGPTQRRFRITPRQRFHQGFQQRGQLGIVLDQRMPSAAHVADALQRQGGRIQFLNAFHDGDTRQSAGTADQRHPAVAQLRGFGGGQHPSRSFIKMRPETLQFPPHCLQQYHGRKNSITLRSCKCYLFPLPNRGPRHWRKCRGRR